MILNQIEDYLRAHGPVPVTDIALHFQTSSQAAIGMLELLEKKGRVKQSSAPVCSTGCGPCSQAEQCFLSHWQLVER